MNHDKESNRPTTVVGLASLIVVQAGMFAAANDVLHAVLDGLRIIAPALATAPIAMMVFIAFMGVLLLLTYAIGLHYKHKASGRYAAPTPKRNSASSIQRRASKARRRKLNK